ncbi:major facilitator superfamily domain-containing protein [Lipomyces japonicus]|uniref:major facilitator superfamily domain-containing protein n=1 Tax=Lipomyces japonicus TaxID=56871 RepID=UPI0034CE41DD
MAERETEETEEILDDAYAPLLPSNTRATLPNPFISSSRSSSFTSSLSPANSQRGHDDLTEDDRTEMDRLKLLTIFVSLYIGVFLSALDGTIVATLLAHIASEFDGFRNVSWIATAYLIACAAFQPLYGKLTDIFGRKPGLLFSNITFGIGCLACGLSSSLWFLVAARVVAGIGGGGLTALSTITLSDLVPLRKRGVLQGVGNITFGTGAAAGGVFGGWITEWLGWRWAFLLQVPLIVVSTLAITFALDLPVNEQARDGENELEREERLLNRVDFLGAFTLVAALVVFLIAASISGNQVAWSHPLVVVSFLLSVFLFYAFVYVERFIAKEPIIPVELLKDRTIFGASFTNWFMTMSVYSSLFYIPIYFVSVRGVSETQAGTSLISNFVGVAVGSFGSGVYMRSTGRYYTLALICGVSYIFGTGLISTVGLATPTWVVVLYTFLPGASYGALLTITLIALIAAVPQEFQAVTTSIQYGFRGTGSTIGVAVSSSVFQNVLSSSLHSRIRGTDAEVIISRLLESVDEINRLPEFLVPVARLAFLDASRSVFLLCFFLGIITLGTAMLMREHVLHSTLNRQG